MLGLHGREPSWPIDTRSFNAQRKALSFKPSNALIAWIVSPWHCLGESRKVSSGTVNHVMSSFKCSSDLSTLCDGVTGFEPAPCVWCHLLPPDFSAVVLLFMTQLCWPSLVLTASYARLPWFLLKKTHLFLLVPFTSLHFAGFVFYIQNLSTFGYLHLTAILNIMENNLK